MPCFALRTGKSNTPSAKATVNLRPRLICLTPYSFGLTCPYSSYTSPSPPAGVVSLSLAPSLPDAAARVDGLVDVLVGGGCGFPQHKRRARAVLDTRGAVAPVRVIRDG